MYMKPVPAFTQEDLLNDDCYILDCYDQVYIWIGHLSNKFERKGVIKRADQFLESVTDGRDKENCAMTEVYAGREPASFTVQFIQWEPEVAEEWMKTDPIEIAKAEETKK